jgi:hypothetical protein
MDGLIVETLATQRAHVFGILEGLDAEALARSVLPSGWSCASLVHHLAIDVERFWFQRVLLGRDVPLPDGWELPDGVDPVTLYRAETAISRDIIATTEADAAPLWWPTSFGDFRLADLTEIGMHVITETAVHAGHLDAARELLDGRQWMTFD